VSYPEPVVGALILSYDNEILLIKQAKWNDQYCIPGGHIELGETIEDALIREAKEETGLDISVIKMLGVQDNIHSPSFHKKKHFIFLDYLCKTSQKDVLLDKREAQDFLWCDAEKALELNLAEGTRTTIIRFLSDGRHG
jgi:nucleoside triphosphatase